ncbi:MAG: hypothetical protein HY553_10885 [Elusimicrobia bacterium]|nr:hypothetical protein [Elusimicrobiota bacterium]
MPNPEFEALGREWEGLVVRYQAGETALIERILDVTGRICLRYLGDAVRKSRATASGVAGDKDEHDLLSGVLRKVWVALKNGNYKHQPGKGRAWVIAVAINAFRDSLEWREKKSRKTRRDLAHDAVSLDQVQPKRKARRTKLSDHQEARPEPDPDPDLEAPEPKGETAPGATVELVEAESPADQDAILYEKDFLNCVLSCLRSLSNQEHADVFAARALLGWSDTTAREVFGLEKENCASHFRRASIEVLKALRERFEDWQEASLAGLRRLLNEKLTLTDEDLRHIHDPIQRRAVAFAFGETVSLNDLAEHLSLDADSALRALRSGISTLSRAMLRRVEKAAPRLSGTEADLWLWDQAWAAVRSYPQPLAQVRAADAPADLREALALVEIAVRLGYAGKPARTLAEILTERQDFDRLGETAQALGLDEEGVLSLLSGSTKPKDISPTLIARIGAHYRLDRSEIDGALHVAASEAGRGVTRGASARDGDAWLEYARKRALEG